MRTLKATSLNWSVPSWGNHSKYGARALQVSELSALAKHPSFPARVAWKTFFTHRAELTSKHYSLHNRLRLFDATVTPAFLYGSAAWTLTKQLEVTIRRTQRKMLRMILGSGRRTIQQQRNNNLHTQPDNLDNELPTEPKTPLLEWP